MTTPQTRDPARTRDATNWARPIDRLSAESVTGATVDSVSGKRVAGPLQGFGQLWQKTFRVRLDGVDVTPEALVAEWKANFPAFWPDGATLYAPLAGIAPGEVALLDVAVPGSPVKLSTGVMVLYADDESFTFMTPEGHTLSAWITFSASREGDVTIAQAQALERTSDPFDELAYMMGASKLNDRFWQQTLANLATHVGVAAPSVDAQVVCIDRRRQWRHAGNIRNSATLRTARHTITAPVRWFTRRG
jgi:hypothetical protein